MAKMVLRSMNVCQLLEYQSLRNHLPALTRAREVMKVTKALKFKQIIQFTIAGGRIFTCLA